MASHQLHIALASHTGRLRPHNEDAIGYHYPATWDILNSYGALFVLADGVGGLANGAEAADYAVKRLVELYYHMPLGKPDDMLRHCIQEINSEIFRQHQSSRASTIVALVVRRSDAFLAHIGDSRAYLGKPVPLQLITRDHAAEVVQNGVVKRKLTRALGYRAGVEVTISQHVIETGDVFLLVSDGASRYHDTRGLSELLTENARDSVQSIIDTSNAAGGEDNISAIYVRIGASLADEKAHATHLRQLAELGVHLDIPPYPEQAPKSAGGASPILLLIAILGVVVTILSYFVYLGTVPDSQIVEAIPSTATAIQASLASETATNANPIIEIETINPSVEEESLVGNEIIFESSALSYTQVRGTSSAFLLESDKVYLIEEILIDENETWIRLYEAENERSGWIAEDDMPSYRLAADEPVSASAGN